MEKSAESDHFWYGNKAICYGISEGMSAGSDHFWYGDKASDGKNSSSSAQDVALAAKSWAELLQKNMGCGQMSYRLCEKNVLE